MAIIGWLALCAIMIYLTLVSLLLSANGLCKFNIGGVLNSFWKKVAILVGDAILIKLWFVLIAAGQFTFIGM